MSAPRPTYQPNSRPGLRNAVTLLELTIVLLVLGLISAIAAPRFSRSMRGMHSRSAALQIAAHLNHARRMAINQGRSTTLTFAPSGNGYASPDVDFPGRVGRKLRVNLHDTYDQSVSVVADFDGIVETDSLSITFDLEGVPHVNTTAMQSGLVTVSTPGTPKQFIRIAPGTGRIELTNENDVANPDATSGAGL